MLENIFSSAKLLPNANFLIEVVIETVIILFV